MMQLNGPDIPAALRPEVGQTGLHLASVSAYLNEMAAAGWPVLAPLQELQLMELLEYSERVLASIPYSNPVVEITEFTGPAHKPRSPMLLNALLALINRGHAAFIRDTELAASGMSYYVATLIVQRR